MPWLEVRLEGEAPQRVRVREEGSVIGRHPECDVVLASATVSRRHARIFASGGDFYLEDLGSRHGTEVNGGALEGLQCLDDADEIRIRDARLVFHLHGEPPLEGDILCERDGRAGDATAEVDVSDAPGGLRALLALVRTLGRTLDLEELLPAVLECALRLHPDAERGAIWLIDADGGLVARAARDRSGPCTAPAVSQSVARHVIGKGQALWSRDAASDARFDASRSIRVAGTRSLLSAPLLGSAREALGLLQLDTCAPGEPFRREDLELLVDLAGLAARAVEHARLAAR